MTTTVGAPGARHSSPSVQVAREIRAEIGRQQTSVRQLSLRSGQSYEWWKRRITTSTVPMSLEDIEMVAAALDVPITRLLSAWLTGDGPSTQRRVTERYPATALTLRDRNRDRSVPERVNTPTRRGTVPATAAQATATARRMPAATDSGSGHDRVPVAA